jgi:hypothetical protein
MRAFWVRLFIASFGFLAISTAAYGYITIPRVSEDDVRRNQERNDHCYLKYVDSLTWSCHLGLDHKIANDFVSNRLEARAIVTRKQVAATPTWDGTQPAFIVSPMLWYLDPDSRVQALNLQHPVECPEAAEWVAEAARWRAKAAADQRLADWRLRPPALWFAPPDKYDYGDVISFWNACGRLFGPTALDMLVLSGWDGSFFEYRRANPDAVIDWRPIMAQPFSCLPDSNPEPTRVDECIAVATNKPTYVFNPMLWFFDPDSPVHKMNLKVTALRLPATDVVDAKRADRLSQRHTLLDLAIDESGNRDPIGCWRFW